MNKNTQFAHSTAPMILAIATVLSACGGGSVNSLAPRTLTLDPTLSSPQPDTDGVGISQSLTIAVKEELDISTVTAANVHLMPGAGHGAMNNEDEDEMGMMNNDPIPGTVTYNQVSKTITFTPSKALDQGRMYHVHASNLLLKGGKEIKTGVDTIQYNFTTMHAHEIKRLEYLEDGVTLKEDRRTTVVNNERTQRTQYTGTRAGGVIDYIRKYNQFLPGTALQTSYYTLDENNVIGRYERDITQNGKTYTVRFNNVNTGNQQLYEDDEVRNFWTPDIGHGSHQISYQYEPTDTAISKLWPATGNPETDTNFELDDAQLMEMNHGAPVSGNESFANFQHRHIFYGDLGDNKDIDFDTNGNPAPVDDRVAVYHTRDMNNYLRTLEWSWNGLDRDNVTKKGHGADGILFTADDIAYRVRVYIYNTLGQVVQRVTYEVEDRNTAPYGNTRTDWMSILQTDGYVNHQTTYSPGLNSNLVHSHRSYEYNGPGGSLNKVTVNHTKDNSTELYREEVRFYSTQATVDGNTATYDNLN